MNKIRFIGRFISLCVVVWFFSQSHGMAGHSPSISPVSEELLKERQELLNQYRRRNLELRDLVELEETKAKISVNIFVNKFFLPNSATLLPDGLSALNQLSGELRKRHGKQLALRTIFKASSAETDLGKNKLGFGVTHRSAGAQLIQLEESVPDSLIIQRSMIIFSYLVSSSLRNTE